MIGPLDGPWLAATALLLLAVVVRRSPRPDRRELLLIAVIAACAAVARVVCGIWGPLHVNGQGPLWVRGALDPALLAGSYGPGYFELFGWVGRLGVIPDRAVFAANALLSALSPALLYATARLVGVERSGALAAAVVLAADAVAVRTAASEGYYSSITALVLGVQAALALGLRAQLRRDWPGAALALAAAALLAAAAARIHPVSYLPLALSPLVVLSSAQPERWRTRLARAAVAAAALGAVVLLTSAQTIQVALRAPIAGHAIGSLPRGEWQLLLVLLAAVWLLHRWAQPPWLPMLGVFSLAAMLATEASFQMHPMQNLAYQRLFWPGLLLGVAPLFPRRLRALGWGLAGGAVATALVLVTVLPHLGAPTTEQLEYDFLRESLQGMPPDCTLAGVSRAGKRLWDIPSYLAPGASAQRSVGSAADLAAAPGNCLLYVRSSLCSSVEARSICDSVEREARLERVASRVFPAAPSYAGLPYDRPEVETVLFRVTEHRAGVNDGAAITPAFAQALYARLTSLREPDGCRIVRFDTSRFRVTVALQTPAGAEHAVEFATAAQRGTGATEGWAVAAPAGAERDCGATMTGLRRVLGEIGTPAAAGAVEPTG